MRTLIPMPCGSRSMVRAMPAHSTRRRSGFTIIEVIVAIVLISTAVIALASSSAVILRNMTSSKQATIAASVASDRLEMLRSYNRCARLRDSTVTTRGIKEQWGFGAQVGVGLYASKPVDYSVSYAIRGDSVRRTFNTAIPCRAP